MFKKFSNAELGPANIAKTSVVRGIKSKLIEQMPNIEPLVDELMPKKEHTYIIKCKNRVTLIAAQGEFLFFQNDKGPWLPTLRLLHKYPNLLPHFQVDKGAIKFVLSGADIMCPGLTSPGAKMDEVDADTPVAIMAEGKQHALGIGMTKMSSADIAKVNKDIGVLSVVFLNDGMWHLDPRPLNVE